MGFDLERARREALRPQRDPLAKPGQGIVLGRVASTPSGALKYFNFQPATILGAEVEGGTATFDFLSTTRVAVKVGQTNLSVGDYVVCRHVDYRWVADASGKLARVCVNVFNGCNTSQPLLASVTLLQGGSSVGSGTTSGAGQICFESIPPGSYSVVVQSVTYPTRCATSTTPITVGTSDVGLNVTLGAATDYMCCHSALPPIKIVLTLTDANGFHGGQAYFTGVWAYDAPVAETLKSSPLPRPPCTNPPDGCHDGSTPGPGATPVTLTRASNCFTLTQRWGTLVCPSFGDGCGAPLTYTGEKAREGPLSSIGQQIFGIVAGFPGTPHLPPWTITFPSTTTSPTGNTIAVPVSGTVILDE